MVLASQAPANTGVLAGRVIDGTTGQPVAGAAVRLGRASALPGQPAGPAQPIPPHGILTNAQGHFVFTGLAPGRYTVSSQAPGYVTGQHGQQRLEGPSRPITLAADQRVVDATIRMWRFGVITGVVRDEAGDPIPDVRVHAPRRMWVGGQPRFVPRSQATTDDRGIFRIPGLVPGDYLVTVPATLTAISRASAGAMVTAYRSGASSIDAATEFGASPFGASLLVGDWFLQRPTSTPVPPGLLSVSSLDVYQTTYHPQATHPGDATIVHVNAGEERSAVDLHLRPVHTFTVSGVVTGTDGRPMRAGLRLLPVGAREFDRNGEFATATTGSDTSGRFALLGVPPGQYVISYLRIPQGKWETTEIAPIERSGAGVEGGRVIPPPVTAPVTWGETTVTVSDRPVDGVAVLVRPGFHVRGTMEFREASARPTAEQIQRIGVSLVRVDGGLGVMPTPASEVAADGRFMTSQYLPGRYFVTASALPPGWALRSAVVAGRDAVASPLELGEADVNDVVLTFSGSRPRLTGAVTLGAGQEAEATVMVFPEDYRAWIANGMPAAFARTLAVGREAAFDVADLLPGAYLAVAVGPGSNEGVQNPEHVATLARLATRVTLGEDGVSTVSLPVTSVTPRKP
jgi:protocatechuate 3,4-dioxygenase beta subunit